VLEQPARFVLCLNLTVFVLKSGSNSADEDRKQHGLTRFRAREDFSSKTNSGNAASGMKHAVERDAVCFHEESGSKEMSVKNFSHPSQ
jgi:hypothetical protein